MNVNDRLAAWLLPFWMFFLTLPQMAFSSWEARKESEAAMVYYQALGAVMFVSFCFLFMRRGFLSSHMFRFYGKSGVSFFCFSLSLLVSSFYSSSVLASLLYALFTISVFIAFSAYWHKEEVVLRSFKISAFVLLLFLVVSLLIHGMPGGRTVGGIVPNRYAKIALIFMVMAFYVWGGWGKTIAFFLAIFFAGLVTSRSTLAAIVFFMILYFLLTFRVSKRKDFMFFLLFFCSFLFVLSVAFEGIGVSDFYYSIFEKLEIFSEERGFGSGMTGRTDYWIAGLEKIKENPLGYGFRGDKGGVETAHNGYLNLFLDVGILGFVCFFVFVYFVFSSLFMSRRSSVVVKDISGVKRSSVSISFLATVFLLWFSEPSYINIGLEFSVLSIMFLSVPLRGGRPLNV